MKYSVIILVVFISFQTFSQQTYKLNKKLEVMMEDLGKMKFEDAKKACDDLGEGWRLPTKKELKLLYRKSDDKPFCIDWDAYATFKDEETAYKHYKTELVSYKWQRYYNTSAEDLSAIFEREWNNV